MKILIFRYRNQKVLVSVHLELKFATTNMLNKQKLEYATYE